MTNTQEKASALIQVSKLTANYQEALCEYTKSVWKRGAKVTVDGLLAVRDGYYGKTFIEGVVAAGIDKSVAVEMAAQLELSFVYNA